RTNISPREEAWRADLSAGVLIADAAPPKNKRIICGVFVAIPPYGQRGSIPSYRVSELGLRKNTDPGTTTLFRPILCDFKSGIQPRKALQTRCVRQNHAEFQPNYVLPLPLLT